MNAHATRQWPRDKSVLAGLIVRVRGDWVIDNAADLEKVLDDICPSCEGVDEVVFQCDGLRRVDTSGSWLLYKQYKVFESRDVKIRFVDFKDEHFRFVKNLLDVLEDDEVPPGRNFAGLEYGLHRLGRLGVNGVKHVGEVFLFLGQLFMTFLAALVHPSRFRPRSVLRHIREAGINAVPIVALMAFLVAIVMAYQGATQLRNFGAEYYTIGLTVRSTLREMGVLMAAILIAGRSGSAFATEIGIMKINEEVDAMKTLSLDPYEVLVLPRVLALVIIMPFVTFLSNLAGLAGGAVTTNLLLDIPLNQYWGYLQSSIAWQEFWIGMVKSPFFAFLIATTGCFRGLQAESSAESVGRLTTISVVQAIFLVLAANAVFAIIFGELGY